MGEVVETMPTREENRAPHEVALFRSLDPWYGYGTKHDFDRYFAQHGYPYGSHFGPSNTPSLPYPNYETADVAYGAYHRPTYAYGYGPTTAYSRHGPHYGQVVGPDDYSQSTGGYAARPWDGPNDPRHFGAHHYYGHYGHPGPFAPAPAPAEKK